MIINKNHCGFFLIIGKTNTGKSTLLNTLIKKNISIVSKKKQTTRSNIIGVNTKLNKQKIFIDSPGIDLRQNKKINKIMNMVAIKKINSVDIIILMLDRMYLDQNDIFIIKKIKKIKKPIIILINKIDKIKNKKKLLPHIKKISKNINFKEIIPISAKTGENIYKLKKIINDITPQREHYFPYKYITNQSKKFFISEIIRKEIISNLYKELPYSINTELKHLTKKNNKYHIICSIWIEKKSQKKIIIGENGKKIKKIKKEIEKKIINILKKKIILNLIINVKKKWRNNKKLLNKINLEY